MISCHPPLHLVTKLLPHFGFSVCQVDILHVLIEAGATFVATKANSERLDMDHPALLELALKARDRVGAVLSRWCCAVALVLCYPLSFPCLVWRFG